MSIESIRADMATIEEDPRCFSVVRKPLLEVFRLLLNEHEAITPLMGRVQNSSALPAMALAESAIRKYREPLNDTFERVLICVIGMGRSGTSLLCQILSHLGVYFGEPDELIKANALNERGFYEHAAINDILERALRANGVDWLTDQPIPTDWYLSKGASEAQWAIIHHLSALTTRSVLGFKNPRAALFLPLFRNAFTSLRLDPVYIRCLRDPHEVHESINRINSPKTQTFTLHETLAVWANYYTASQAVDAIDVWYEDWFRETSVQLDQLERIERHVFARAQQPARAASALGVIDPELRHAWHKRHVRIIERVT